jgi:hypothetical protein
MRAKWYYFLGPLLLVFVAEQYTHDDLIRLFLTIAFGGLCLAMARVRAREMTKRP